MKNKKNKLALLILLMLNISIFGQDATTATTDNTTTANTTATDNTTANQNPTLPGESPADTGNFATIETDPNATSIGSPRVADEKLSTILIDNFEVPQGWIPNMPIDFGLSKILYRDGSPQEIAGDTNKVVLGVKTVFFRRNYGWMSIDRPYPLSLKNIVRNFNIWLSGRNKRHVFSIKIRDVDYNRMRLSGGEMKFQGWKKISIPVSDSINQYNIARDVRGLDFLGFHIDFVAEDTSTTGPYYLYLDQFTVDMNAAPAYENDDISDDW